MISFILALMASLSIVNLALSSDPARLESPLTLKELTSLKENTEQNRASWQGYQAFLVDEYKTVKAAVEQESDPILNAYMLSKFLEKHEPINNPFSEEDDQIKQFAAKALMAFRIQASKFIEENKVFIKSEVFEDAFCPEKHRAQTNNTVTKCEVKPLSADELCPDYFDRQHREERQKQIATSRQMLRSRYIKVDYQETYDASKKTFEYAIVRTENRVKSRVWFCDSYNNLIRRDRMGREADQKGLIQ